MDFGGGEAGSLGGGGGCVLLVFFPGLCEEALVLFPLR